MATEDEDNLLHELVERSEYPKQAQYFLNAFWTELGEQEADLIFETVEKFGKWDKKDHNHGKSLNEWDSHKLLEDLGQTLTVLEMRAALAEIDVDHDGRMSAYEYFLHAYEGIDGVDLHELLTRPQGTNDAVERAMAALDAVQAQIDDIEGKKAKYLEIGAGTGVKAMRAKNQFDQLVNADPLELNRALVTAKSKVKRAQKVDDVTMMGTIWWSGRELAEAQKYQPKGDGRSWNN